MAPKNMAEEKPLKMFGTLSPQKETLLRNFECNSDTT
jgi:hypothetical protein